MLSSSIADQLHIRFPVKKIGRYRSGKFGRQHSANSCALNFWDFSGGMAAPVQAHCFFLGMFIPWDFQRLSLLFENCNGPWPGMNVFGRLFWPKSKVTFLATKIVPKHWHKGR